MKKLKLDLDALAVETFDPSPLEEGPGTVLGEQWGGTQITPLSCARPCFTAVFTCGHICQTNLGTCVTCHLSCNGTCHVSCNRTCVTCQVTCGINTCITCDTCRATCYTCLTCLTACYRTCGYQCTIVHCP
jgi:hypothetical protein